MLELKKKKKDSIGVFQILLFVEFLPLKCKIIVQSSYVIIAMRSLYYDINVRNYYRLKSVMSKRIGTQLLIDDDRIQQESDKANPKISFNAIVGTTAVETMQVREKFIRLWHKFVLTQEALITSEELVQKVSLQPNKGDS